MYPCKYRCNLHLYVWCYMCMRENTINKDMNYMMNYADSHRWTDSCPSFCWPWLQKDLHPEFRPPCRGLFQAAVYGELHHQTIGETGDYHLNHQAWYYTFKCFYTPNRDARIYPNTIGESNQSRGILLTRYLQPWKDAADRPKISLGPADISIPSQWQESFAFYHLKSHKKSVLSHSIYILYIVSHCQPTAICHQQPPTVRFPNKRRFILGQRALQSLPPSSRLVASHESFLGGRSPAHAAQCRGTFEQSGGNQLGGSVRAIDGLVVDTEIARNRHSRYGNNMETTWNYHDHPLALPWMVRLPLPLDTCGTSEGISFEGFQVSF